ncbi:MAG: type IV pilus secretin PilQ [Proteobacteria bacterium]|nr:type IV pilus secretin PilQ [Pseudomonadota bacterium]
MKVQSIDLAEDNTSYLFKVFSDKSLVYTSYSEENPPKLILEFPVIDFGNFVGEKVVNKGFIKSYKITQLGRQENYTGKIEILFTKKPEFAIERLAQGITVYIKKDTFVKEEQTKSEPITINNILFSGDNKKFVAIVETSGKPDALNYVLKNPLRLVFDIQSAKYSLSQKNFITNNNIVKSIRVEPFPNLTRLFIDINIDKVPVFISRAEKDKLVIELSTEEMEKKDEKVIYLTLDTVDFIPEPKRNLFRFKDIHNADYKVYKLSDTVLVFEFKGVRLNKAIQKTYDIKEVSELLSSFTLYQVKPEEENRVRFVAILKDPISYRTEKAGKDIVIEFNKEKVIAKAEDKPKELVKQVTPPTPAPAPLPKETPKVEESRIEKKEAPKIEEKPKEEVKPKPKEEVIAVEKKAEPKQEEIKAEKKEPVKTEEKAKVEEKPKEEIRPKEEKKIDVVKKEEKKEPEKKIEVKKEEKAKETVITIKSKEEPAVSETKEDKQKQQIDSRYKGRPITINLKDAEIQHIFKLLTEVAKLDGEILNIVTSDDVKGRLSIQLEEVPWDQVLDVVMEVNNLGMKKVGNILRVMPKDRLKREQEDLLAASKIREKVENLILEIVPINYAEANDFVDKIKPLLSSRGSVTIDKRNNSLIINDIKDNIDEAKKLIVKLDTPPQQVVIEARVVEASSDFSKEMGIQWGVKLSQTIGDRYRAGVGGPNPTNVGNMGSLDLTGTGVTPAPYMVNLPAAIGAGAGGGINFALVNLRSGAGLDIQLSAMENKGVGKILSRPKITTLNNVEANIQQGSSIPYETLSDKGTQTQFIDASLQLTVTPRITPDNSIILKVKVSNNNPNTALRSAGGVPSIDKNEATTEILVRDGQTIVIGGIIRNKETVSKGGVPFLMDIPLIGWLFKKEAKAVENRELLIFLTPSIIKPIKEVEAS